LGARHKGYQLYLFKFMRGLKLTRLKPYPDFIRSVCTVRPGMQLSDHLVAQQAQGQKDMLPSQKLM
jgi:hypothetical protein